MLKVVHSYLRKIVHWYLPITLKHLHVKRKRLPVHVPSHKLINKYSLPSHQLVMSKLTIKQAVQYTGKSEATIRRLVKKWSVPSHAYAKFVQKKKAKYYISEQALKDHFELDHDAQPETENDQKYGGITGHFIEHLRNENRELHARIKELTHLVAQQNKMISDKDDKLNALQYPLRQKRWKFLLNWGLAKF